MAYISLLCFAVLWFVTSLSKQQIKPIRALHWESFGKWMMHYYSWINGISFWKNDIKKWEYHNKAKSSKYKLALMRIKHLGLTSEAVERINSNLIKVRILIAHKVCIVFNLARARGQI